jgi:Tol biopolymer transport system component
MGSSRPGRARRLTHDGRRKLAPAFLNAREIAVAVHTAPTLVAILRLGLEGGAPQRLHPSATAHQFDPAFSRDGRLHAFALSATSPQMVLVIQDLRDRQEHAFRPRDARATARRPTFAPDGTRVAFGLSDLGGHQIASVNVQGKDLKLLTNSAGLNAMPAYSPDGKHIAFSSSRDGDFEIYVMDADGGNVRRLTHSPGLDTRPAWSPDGKRIAFTSNRDGCYRVHVMNADGSGPRCVSDHTGRDDYAAWHPDGGHLLVVSERDGQSDLYLLEVPA